MSVNEKMTAIADSIRGYTTITKPLSLDEMPSGINDVYNSGYSVGYTLGNQAGFDIGKVEGIEEGKKTERDDFWEVFQKGGEPMNYNYAFGYNKFKDENYFPKYDINVMSGNTTANYMFNVASDITDTKVTIDASKANNTQNMFSSCTNLKKIPKLIVGANTGFANTFNACEALEELYIEGTIAKNGLTLQYSTKLNKASIESIINALSKTTSGLTVTLSKTAVNNAFTAEEWDALEATKTNWTISLV
jgi:hypothetical protein